MDRTGWSATAAGLALAASLLAAIPLHASGSPPESGGEWKDVKLCLVCHKSTYGMVWGYFDSVSTKSSSIQLNLSDGLRVARFDPASLKFVGGAFPDDLERSLRSLCPGDDVRVEYEAGKDGLWFVTEIAVKPFMDVSPEMRVSAEDVEKLLSGKGRFALVDARPAANYLEGSIPTAVNVPYPAFHENLDRLPKDKGVRVVFFCAGAT
jgi:hypothetical protein